MDAEALWPRFAAIWSCDPARRESELKECLADDAGYCDPNGPPRGRPRCPTTWPASSRACRIRFSPRMTRFWCGSTWSRSIPAARARISGGPGLSQLLGPCPCGRQAGRRGVSGRGGTARPAHRRRPSSGPRQATDRLHPRRGGPRSDGPGSSRSCCKTSSLQDELSAAGGHFVAGEAFGEYVVTDGRPVTGQNPASSKRAAEKVLALLGRN